MLIGMMGVGKSTVGRRVAKELSRPFVDSDDEVVARTGRAVTEIFATDGEAAFRDIEAEAMADLLASAVPSVIAAAGGSVLSSSTRDRLRESGTVVWMRAPVDVLVGRTSRGTHRPALANDPRATLAQMETDRVALYSEVADITVDCTAPIAAVVGTIVRSVNEVDAQ
ncbi:MAG: shikimate kinase [Actinobacteria bacterium]|nr:shikimate kinase [Actinomycetota bacterium]